MLAYNKMLEKNGKKNSKIGYSKIFYLFIYYYYYYYYVVIFLCFSIIKESKKGKDKVKDNTKDNRAKFTNTWTLWNLKKEQTKRTNSKNRIFKALTLLVLFSCCFSTSKYIVSGSVLRCSGGSLWKEEGWWVMVVVGWTWEWRS